MDICRAALYRQPWFGFARILIATGACLTAAPSRSNNQDLPGVHRCRNAAGMLVFQDHPCRGELYADTTDAGSGDGRSGRSVLQWQLDRRQCVLRSAWVSLYQTPAAAPSDPALEPAFVTPEAPMPSPLPSPLTTELDPDLRGEGDESTPLTRIRLELRRDLDGVVVQIRGFDPPSPGPDHASFRFSPDIDGQGLSLGSTFFEVDALAASNRLRFGFRKNQALIRQLSTAEAELKVRIEGFGSLQQRLPKDGIAEPLSELLRCGKRR